MSRNNKPKAELLAAISGAIKKASSRSSGEFDGLYGSLPAGTGTLLEDVVAYLRQYLLDERGLAESEIRRIVAGRSLSQRAEDEGVRVALGVLNSIASALRVSDKQAVRVLLSGKDGVRGARVREGGGKRGLDTRERQQRRAQAIRDMVEKTARQYPDRPYRELARHAARALGCHERTVRRIARDPRVKGKRGTTA
jgi:hypothetical protein